MKTLTESMHTALCESLVGTVQARAEIISKNKQGEDEYGMIRLDHEVAVGENSACIDAINATGDIVRLDIDGSSDAINIKFFSDDVLKNIIKELDAMIKKIK